MNKNTINQLVLFGFALLLTAALYLQGVNGPFLFDDFHNLGPIAIAGGVDSWGDALRYAFGGDGRQFSRSLARLSFLISDQYWPTQAMHFKLVNIAIHLINGLLIALLLLRLLPALMSRASAQRVAFLCAALWLLHPLHVSTTLYVVQRMTQLMLLFLLLSLIFYVIFRNAKTLFSAVTALSCSAICALLSVLAKENGATLLLLFPLLEWYCCREQPARFQSLSKKLSALAGLIFIALFTAVVIDKYENFGSRFYTLADRLQIQGAVLADYLRMIILPANDGLSLFHDDVEWRLQTQGVAYAGFFWLIHIAIAGLVWVFRQHRVIVFGVAWFYICHLIESTALPLELMFEHRNYLPSIGLILVFAYLLDMAYTRLKEASLPVAGIMLFVLPLSLIAVQLAYRAALWHDYRILNHKWATEHPDSLRAQYARIILLERDGFPVRALEEVSRIELQFNDATLPLYRIRLGCQLDPFYEAETKLDIKSLAAINYSSGIGPVLKDLLKFDDKTCINNQLSNGNFVEMVAAIEDMPLLRSKKRYHAQYLDIVDGYYIKNLDYTRAIIARERLWQVQPTVDTALKLAELFMLGGNSEQARKYIDWSKQKNDELWFNDRFASINISRLDQKLTMIENRR